MLVRFFSISVLFFVLINLYGQQTEPVDSTKKEVSVNKDVNSPDTIGGFWFVEENATFNAGDIKNFNAWFIQHLTFTEDTIDPYISKFVVEFSVDTLGNVCNVKMIRDISPVFDENVIRTLYSSPKWSPAKQNGKAVKQRFIMPVHIHFR